MKDWLLEIRASLPQLLLIPPFAILGWLVGRLADKGDVAAAIAAGVAAAFLMGTYLINNQRRHHNLT